VAAEEGRAAFIDLCNWCHILRQTRHDAVKEPSASHANEEDYDRNTSEPCQRRLLRYSQVNREKTPGRENITLAGRGRDRF
jgi:hypothetical protein